MAFFSSLISGGLGAEVQHPVPADDKRYDSGVFQSHSFEHTGMTLEALLSQEEVSAEAQPPKRQKLAQQGPQSADEGRSCISAIDQILQSTPSEARKAALITSTAIQCEHLATVRYARQKVEALPIAKMRKTRLLTDLMVCEDLLSRNKSCK